MLTTCTNEVDSGYGDSSNSPLKLISFKAFSTDSAKNKVQLVEIVQ